MEKLLLIDGNSMLFRAYYATVYGNRMSSSSGVPTNAIYGFALMLSRALKTIDPKYVLVAFDHGKDTYRHKEYPEYKGTRREIPEDLVAQFPVVREYLDSLHIVRYEQEGLEADDIIGCLAAQNNREYEVSILTSDKDILQLVDDNTTVWLMQKGITEMARMDPQAVYERFTLVPRQIIDLKGLAGDPSDNIPGVSKVGDKTAIKLLNDYKTVEGVYEHIDEIKGKLQENLINDRDKAFMSKRLATIITDADIDVDITGCLNVPEGRDAYDFYMRYDMRSLADKVDLSGEKVRIETPKRQFREKSFITVKSIAGANLSDKTAIALDEQSGLVALCNENGGFDMKLDDFLDDPDVRAFLLSEKVKIVYDIKKWYHLLASRLLDMKGNNQDLMIMAFLCDSKLKNISDLFARYGLSADLKSASQLDLFDTSDDYQPLNQQASRLLFVAEELSEQLHEKDMEDLYYQLELPIARILADMEMTGVCCNESTLDEIAAKTSEKIEYHQQRVWELAGKQFNINSPKQLAEVIYDDLALTRSSKRSTDVKVLSKLADRHPIIDEILQYRKYSKLYSTYAFGLKKYIQKDGKIHTVFNQCIAETGRLSSSDPNLQNISVRNEESQLIRSAFVPEEGCVLVGADYSQVELRMLAHMADEKNLIDAFCQGMDIHTKTAMDVFGVSEENVTSAMRRQAKAINFGIDYGMSAFGLSEQLQIPVSMARDFIDTYYRQYPKVREFMENTIRECQEKGYVTTILKRRREIPEISSPDHNVREFGKRAAMNAPVQGSAADLIKLAMIRVYDELKRRNLKSRLILQIHDELILNVPVEEKDIIMEMVEREMEQAMKLKVPLLAQSTWGNNWMEVK
ncbi:MAG: DNA polymerase I [Erysipelotrichaceae bacterium]|nr:DNA polymerase I [Erysipelotrichaceae bacterium]